MRVLTSVDGDGLAEALRSDEFLWVDLTAPDDASLETLGSALPLHPLALADTREFGQRAKLDHYDEASLIVAFGARSQPDGLAVPVEVHLHFAAGFLVTAHPEPVAELEALHDHVAAEPPRPEDAIVYRVLAALVSACEDAVELQAAAFDRLEDRVLQRPRREQLGDIVRLRHAVAGFLRRMESERDLFGEIEHAVLALPELDPAARPYLRDVGDHIDRAGARLAAQHAAAASLTDTYFNANANRLTAITERLTVLATILLPLTLVTGFFGQNFGWLVERIDSLAAFLVLGVGGLVVAALLALLYLLRQAREGT